MSTVRRVLIVITVLLAGAGAAVLLLPYDTVYEVGQIADERNAEVDVPCKAPLVDLVSDESGDDWLNYTPEDGVSFRADGRAGGEFCATTLARRGMTGIGLLFLATFAGVAAVVLGRLKRRPDDGRDAGADVPLRAEDGSVPAPGASDAVDPAP